MICKWMGWAWQDEQETPEEILAVVADMIRDEQRAIEKARRK